MQFPSVYVAFTTYRIKERQLRWHTVGESYDSVTHSDCFDAPGTAPGIIIAPKCDLIPVVW